LQVKKITTIKKDLDLIGKKPNNDEVGICFCQNHLKLKHIVIKRIWTKYDILKYQLWMKLKTILNLINYSKLKKLQQRKHG
jgi:hypothetical protein